MKKKTLLTLSSGAAVLTLLGVVISANHRYFDMVKATTTTQSCAKIEFGTTANNTTTDTIADTSKFTFSGINVTSVSGTKANCSNLGEAAKFGSSSAGGSLTFNFDSLVITSIRLYGFAYSSTESTSVTVATSSYSGTNVSVSDTTLPSIDDLSGTNINLFTGIDGGNGTSSASLTITSTKRFYLAKILFTINGSSTATSSTATSSSVTTSSAAVSSTITSSSSSTYYRVAPNVSSGTSASVYSVSSNGGTYQGTLVSTLTKGNYYTTYEDVAAYWQAFGEMPGNYMCADGDDSSGYSTTKAKAYTAYGASARLWFTYHRTTGYMTQVPVYNTYGDGTNAATYYEIDISTSWSSYNSNRGAERLMAMPYGLTQYGVVPVIFHTTDHYATFTEYLNYSSGWGPSFAGRSDYEMPSTVTYSIV